MTIGAASALPLATSPGGPIPPGVEEKFVEAGGVTFRYLQGGPTHAGPTTGVPLLFLHGYPTWAEVWLPLAQILGGRHSWVAPDLPCHHRTSPLPGKDRSVTSYREAVLAFLDTLPFERVAVVGSSLGGTLAVMLALERPELVSRLVLLDAAGLTPKVPGRVVRLYLPFLVPAAVQAPSPAAVHALLRRAVFYDLRYADEGWVRTMVEDWAPPDRRKAYVATGFALRRPDASVAGALEHITIPTYVIWGREDPQFLWGEGEAASRRMPTSQFAVLSGCGHFPMVERSMETANLLTDFLAEDVGL
ncbi:MAG: alpha/beta fold hydrolase [Methanobacteriota archaeon]|nr:MAG: alpha/beta fold hydrolase [Euryarchaeota archaeon]